MKKALIWFGKRWGPCRRNLVSVFLLYQRKTSINFKRVKAQTCMLAWWFYMIFHSYKTRVPQRFAKWSAEAFFHETPKQYYIAQYHETRDHFLGYETHLINLDMPRIPVCRLFCLKLLGENASQVSLTKLSSFTEVTLIPPNWKFTSKSLE
jgi:hypothetical protein